MRLRSFAATVALVLSAACASSSAPDASALKLAEPDLQLVQLSTVAEAARHITGAIPVQYRVLVKNNASQPITLEQVQLQSIGAGAYDLRNQSHPVNLTIAPGETKSADFFMSGYISDPTVFGANGPVSIRLTGMFNSSQGKFTKTIVEQVHYEPTQGQ